MCSSAAESTEHLFLQCPFAASIWNWLSGVINQVLDLSSVHSLLSVCNRNWCSQLKDVILAAVTNVCWIIWHCRNKLRFEGKTIPTKAAINLVVANVNLTSRITSGTMHSFVSSLMILKQFNINVHLNKAPSIVQVNWYPPFRNWIKCNTDGAAKGPEDSQVVVEFSGTVMRQF